MISEREMSDEIRLREFYRGVGIHDCQPEYRVNAEVKPAIDDVMLMGDVSELYTYLGGFRNPPEARLLAGAMLKAIFAAAVTERRQRPIIDMERVGALLATLNSRKWRSAWHYGSILHALAPPLSQWSTIMRDPESMDAVLQDKAELRREKEAALATDFQRDDRLGEWID